MIEALTGVTKDMGLLALDAYALRHKLIASNIANHASAGYAPLALDFESALSGVREAAARGAPEAELRRLLGDAAQSAAVTARAGESVRLDEEMAALARNTVQYQALLAALGKLGSLERMAVRGDAR